MSNLLKLLLAPIRALIDHLVAAAKELVRNNRALLLLAATRTGLTLVVLITASHFELLSLHAWESAILAAVAAGATVIHSAATKALPPPPTR